VSFLQSDAIALYRWEFLLVKYYSPATNVCIIRVARDQHNLAWGALTLLTSIEGMRYIPNVVHVSGKLYLLSFECWVTLTDLVKVPFNMLNLLL
jgi:hypothetical protein